MLAQKKHISTIDIHRPSIKTCSKEFDLLLTYSGNILYIYMKVMIHFGKLMQFGGKDL